MTTNWFNEPDEPDDEQPQAWTLADIYNDLGTIYDVAREMDISKYRILAWVQRRERIKCPVPVRTIANAHVYSIQEWKDWFAHWSKGRKAGTAWTDKAKPYGNSGLATMLLAEERKEHGRG